MKTITFSLFRKTILGLLAAGAFVLSAQARVLVTTNSTWRYFKGTGEASTPTNAWRELDFDDSAWPAGAAPFHCGTNAVGGDDKLIEGTILSDMRSHYTCLFLRQQFVLPDTNNVRGLWLNAWYDDGLAIWINGQAARNPISVSGLAYTNTATSPREGSTRNALALSSAMIDNGFQSAFQGRMLLRSNPAPLASLQCPALTARRAESLKTTHTRPCGVPHRHSARHVRPESHKSE